MTNNTIIVLSLFRMSFHFHIVWRRNRQIPSSLRTGRTAHQFGWLHAQAIRAMPMLTGLACLGAGNWGWAKAEAFKRGLHDKRHVTRAV